MTTHRTVTHKTSNDGHSARGAMEAAVPELKARLRHLVDSGKTRVTGWRDGFQDGVRVKPVQSVLIAVAVGAVIGLLVGRRSSN